MKSAIEQMCYGLRGTYESVKVTKRYTSIMGKACDADEALTKLLKEDSEEGRLYLASRGKNCMRRKHASMAQIMS